MLNETEEVEVVEEDNDESYEDDTTTEAESTETTEETVERKPETSEQRITRLKRQLEREERKLNPESKEERKESSKESPKKEDQEVDVTERLDRSDLRFEGVKDKGEQDIIIEYAKYKNMDVLDAMNTPAIKAELKEYRAKSATPSPTRRTSQGARDDVAYWAEQLQKGNRPPTAELRTKAREYLAKNK